MSIDPINDAVELGDLAADYDQKATNVDECDTDLREDASASASSLSGLRERHFFFPNSARSPRRR